MLAVFNSLGAVASRVGLWGKQHAPEIMIVGGIIGGAGATVLACVATAKSTEVIKEAKAEISLIEEHCQKKYEGEQEEEYTEEDAKKDRRKICLKTAGTLTKYYAPAALLGAASMVSILGGANILNKRNAILASSLAASISEFDTYRKKLIERFGEDGERIDKELRFNAETVEVKEKVTDENGKTKTVKKSKLIVNGKGLDGEYTRIFDCRNPYWDKDSTYCEVFLSARQAMFNDRLRAYGWVHLNDVLEELGFPKTNTGHHVGWVYDPSRSDIDNYIDFGVTPVEVVVKDGTDSYRVIENGTRNSGYLLDFNVDGFIDDSVPWPDVVSKNR